MSQRTRIVDGWTALTVGDAQDGVEAAFVPRAGMVACSLRHRGDELLGQRGGLEGYVTRRQTMGIPLLYPWANRLGRRRFSVAGREVVLDGFDPPLRTDAGGLVMHGLLAGADGWRVERHEPDTLAARFDFAADDRLLAAFPFPHELRLEATVRGSSLAIAVEVLATGDVAVPVAFGFHPYFVIPGVDRAAWEVEIPVPERLVLDEAMLPTGEREPVDVGAGPLDERTFDDGYVAPPDGAPFVLSGGGRRIEVRFEEGYPYAQVFAPAAETLVAYEPMTAPTNALVRGGDELPLVAPGERFRATFVVAVT